MLRYVAFVVLLVCASVPAMGQSENPKETALTEPVVNRQPDGRSSVVHCWLKERMLTLWDTATESKAIGFVACDESVTILSDGNIMTKVRTKDGLEGYLADRVLDHVAAAPKESAGPFVPAAPKLSRTDKNYQKLHLQNPSWSSDEITGVMQHRVWVGMDSQMLFKSVGHPAHINTTYLANGRRSDMLVYVDDPGSLASLFTSWHFFGYIYLDDYIVTAIQTSD